MKIRTLFLILSLFLLSSCITKYLWGDKNYEEEIRQFYVGQDARYVVLVANEYHYIFTDNSGVLREILSLKQNGILSLSSKTYLKLDKNNNIQGTIILEGPFDLLPREDAIKLQLLGFTPNKKNDVEIKLELVGRRYSARYINQNPSTNLNNSYFIKVYYHDDIGVAEGVGKAAITPIAVTLDAVLLIGKVVIYPLTLPYRQFGIQ